LWFGFIRSRHALFTEPQPADAEAVRRAVRWVERLEARGGTEMASALRLALRGDEASARVRQVIFLTDGAVGNEEQLFRLIQDRLGDARLFTVGIGSAPNSHFMTKAAQLGRGTFTYIGRIEEVKTKMDELFTKLETPVLKGLQVKWPVDARAESWPARIPDLYAGEPLVVTAALEKLDGDVLVSGERDGQLWQAKLPLGHGHAGAGVGSLWAREKVGSLVDRMRQGDAEGQFRAQILELAIGHRLVTQYTSFVAVDKTPARPAADQLKLGAVPTLLPEGWEYDKVFGELPRGATDSRFGLLTGALALLLAGSLLFVRRRLA